MIDVETNPLQSKKARREHLSEDHADEWMTSTGHVCHYTLRRKDQSVEETTFTYHSLTAASQISIGQPNEHEHDHRRE